MEIKVSDNRRLYIQILKCTPGKVLWSQWTFKIYIFFNSVWSDLNPIPVTSYNDIKICAFLHMLGNVKSKNTYKKQMNKR